MLTNEIKQKSNILDKIKKNKPGAPVPKPPSNAPAGPESGIKHESVAQFLDLKDEIEAKN